MPPHPHRPPELDRQVFRGSDAIRRGLLSRHHLRGASWVRLRQDVYADARLDRDHALACRAALLRMPPGTVIAGPSAAYLHGVTHAAEFTDDVHVLVPAAVRADSQPGVRVHQAPLAGARAGLLVPAGAGASDAAGSSRVGGPFPADRPPGAPGRSRPPAPTRPSVVATPRPRIPAGASDPGGPPNPGGPPPCTDPAACAWETAVWADPVRAVAIIDTLLGTGAVSRSTLATEAARNACRPGARRASWVFGLADGLAQSPRESHLRVRLMFAGLPRPMAQHPVRVSAGLVLHPGLAWPQYRVAVEYDDERRADPERTHLDRRRLDQLARAGWLVLHIADRRLRKEFPALVREIRSTLVARGWRP
ncbi:hypothetical protein [Micromonospora sp. DT31]|uniref:hypothetical protein n=1 Tax=Micromonospora sp. DT31 TaxID=3393434 RepID=UPI003CEDD5A3